MKRLTSLRLNALGVVAFLTGFALMAYELVAARLLAPTLGSSIYVWTSVIGVIIAALSLGYWLGGKLADARQKPLDVVMLCIVAALGTLITVVSHSAALPWIADVIEDVRLQGVAASLLLFAPTSFVIGCVSPYLAKLNIKTLKTAGESVANLSALNSIGGIIGTFVTGFILFGYIGSNETLVVVVIFLLVSSWLLVPKERVAQRVAASILILGLSLIPLPLGQNQIARIDTPSAHYDVSRLNYDGEPIIGLSTGPGGIQSAVYAGSNDNLVFWYTNFAANVIKAQSPESVLVLGGGAFTVPHALAKSLPDATIDAVEIDPALESISKEYFKYADSPNVNLVFEDARSFVNTTDKKYDVIFVDVFGDSYTPFSILTKEYGEKIKSILNPYGVVVVNAIAGVSDECQELLSAIDATYRPYLPQAYWATQSGNPISRGNYILVYSPTANIVSFSMKPLAQPGADTLYTDNFMPAEKLHYQCQQSV